MSEICANFCRNRRIAASTLTHMPSTPSNMVSTIPQLETSSTRRKNATEKSCAGSTRSWSLMAMSEPSTTTPTSGASTLTWRTRETTSTNKLKHIFRTFCKFFDQPKRPSKSFHQNSVKTFSFASLTRHTSSVFFTNAILVIRICFLSFSASQLLCYA